MADKKGKAAGSSKDAAAPEDDVVDAMGRKVWDKDFYTQKAMDNIMMGPQKIGKRRDPVIPLPSSQRTYLKQRTTDLQLDKDLGKSKVVTQHTIKPMQGGYWCSVCECLIKDSAAYLEHVNGRRHNRNLGMNMKVEKIGVDRVKEKLASMRKKVEQPEPEDAASKIRAAEEAEEEKKRRKKEKKKRKKEEAEKEEGADEPAEKRQKAEAGQDGEEEDEEEEETEEMKMLRQMGLPTGFG
mmetsp:Transcript_98073/g.305711  ORF Transcript_98073/g.305711 Transcript_98073/m.305711 type:complete len:239 (+) Transcript_98073:95-811(+)